MKKYSLLVCLLLLAGSSFAQGNFIGKGLKQAAKATGASRTLIKVDRTFLRDAASRIPNARVAVPEKYQLRLPKEVARLRNKFSQTYPVEKMSPALRNNISRVVVGSAHERTLTGLSPEELESYGASLLLDKEVKGLNEVGFSFSESTLLRPEENIPFNSADEVDLVLNGETLRLDRNSGAEALQMARVLDLSIKEFGPNMSEMTLKEYTVFKVLNRRFQNAYNAFKTEGVWQLDETVPVSKFNYSLRFGSSEGLVPVLKDSVPNTLILKEAKLTAELAGSMADLMLFMGRGSNGWTFNDVLQSFSNTMTPLPNQLRDFTFRNSINKSL